MTSSNYYQAVGKAKKAMFICLTRQIIFLIPAFLIFPKLLGLTGVWLAGPIADFLAILLSGIVIFREMTSLKNLSTEESDLNTKKSVA